MTHKLLYALAMLWAALLSPMAAQAVCFLDESSYLILCNSEKYSKGFLTSTTYNSQTCAKLDSIRALDEEELAVLHHALSLSIPEIRQGLFRMDTSEDCLARLKDAMNVEPPPPIEWDIVDLSFLYPPTPQEEIPFQPKPECVFLPFGYRNGASSLDYYSEYGIALYKKWFM